MDKLTKGLQSFLVRLHYTPDCISHEVAHYLEHLFQLLDADDEEAVLHYFGVLGHGQKSLEEIARERGMTQEKAIERIDTCLRRLAVTPEWEVIKQQNELT